MKNIFIENLEFIEKLLEICSLKFRRYVLNYEPYFYGSNVANPHAYCIYLNDDRVLVTNSLEKALNIVVELE